MTNNPGWQGPFVGKVVHGAGRGKDLGFPTANIQISEVFQVPGEATMTVSTGIYICLLIRCQTGALLPSVMHYGSRPVFKDEEIILEVHALDFNADLYGETVAVLLGEKLRDVADFTTVEALQAQIARDVARAKEWFGEQA